ncbi:MAG: bifunctional DNA primase/polymerase [Patescibacteria group bacterium]|nr:bifunctional DNA primase/polymerase [Patescibacteria group bacterium]
MNTALLSKSAIIQSLLDAGFVLVPLCSPTVLHKHAGKDCAAKNMGKVPTFPNWTDRERLRGRFGVEELKEGNYGVVLGPQDLVVDVDPRNFAAGDKPLVRLLADLEIGPLATFIVKTGGGGLHIYLKIPPAVAGANYRIVNQLKEYPGVEFKSEGRQVAGPGSVHNSGKPYMVAQGAPSAILDAPERLLAAIRQEVTRNETGVKEEGGNNPREFDDNGGVQAQYAEFLRSVALPSVQGQQGDHNAFAVACRGRDYGLSPAVTYDLMLEIWNPRCQPPWGEDELRDKVRHAYRYAKGEIGASSAAADFKPLREIAEGANTEAEKTASVTLKDVDVSWCTNAQGAVVRNFQNLLTYLRWPTGGLANVFAFNTFTGRVEFVNPAPWHKTRQLPADRGITDSDLALLKGYLATKHGFEMPVSAILEAIVNVSMEREFHPVREYLNSLKGTWDGKPRMNFWLQEFLGAEDSNYTRAVGRKVLCAAVMRVFKPGCKFDHVMVLEGVEGIGKSGVCGVLGGEWFADAPVTVHDPDTIQMMQGKWIIELAELEVSTRAESDALKAFITRKVDEGRFAYGRLNGRYPRQSIFIASKNPHADGTYLKEESGMRRWWPVMCHPATKNGIVDFARFKAERNQLWAEVVEHVHTNGEELWMETAELKAAAKKIVETRHAEPAWAEAIAEWMEKFDARDPRKHFLTGRQIFIGALQGMEKQFDRRSALGIAQAMRYLNWRPQVTGGTRGYTPNGEAAQAVQKEKMELTAEALENLVNEL